MEQNALFRKSAIDKLASPERLDVLMQVTSPQGWIALTAIGVILVGVIGWSVLGHIGQRVSGQGMLLRGAGNQTILAGGAGTISSLDINVDDTVAPDQVIGDIKAAEAAATGSAISDELVRAQQDFDRTQRLARNSIADAKSNLSGLDLQLKNNATSVATLKAEVSAKERGQKMGAYSQREVEDAQARERQAEAARENLLAQRRLQEQAMARANSDIQSAQAQLDRVKTNLGLKSGSISEASHITSTVAGRVIALMKRVGDPVRQGEPVATVAAETGQMLAYVYVPDEDGRRLKPGMRVQIDMLSTFKREEYGLLEGTVRSVSPQAVNEAEVSSLVANSVIVKSIFQSGAKTQVVVALTPDAQSPTGYAWSSGSGPDGSIHAGTQIAASVEVASRRPISLVLPVLRDLLGAS